MFVLPSMDDCLPLTVIEAMMTKTAVVGSDIGANPDLVEDGVTGYIISSEDLIVETGGKFLDWEPSAEMVQKIAESRKQRANGNAYGESTKSLANALEKLLLNPDLCRKMGEAGYEKYQREFTLEAFEYKMKEILSSCMEGNSR